MSSITLCSSKALFLVIVPVVVEESSQNFATIRSRDEFQEDRIYRHLEPALAFQLEINRLRTYDLEALPTSNRKMHLYLAKAKVSFNTFTGHCSFVPLYSKVYTDVYVCDANTLVQALWFLFAISKRDCCLSSIFFFILLDRWQMGKRLLISASSSAQSSATQTWSLRRHPLNTWRKRERSCYLRPWMSWRWHSRTNWQRGLTAIMCSSTLCQRSSWTLQRWGLEWEMKEMKKWVETVGKRKGNR